MLERYKVEKVENQLITVCEYLHDAPNVHHLQDDRAFPLVQRARTDQETHASPANLQRRSYKHM